ncbi:Mediator of RNA polymerase II transcription subunit 20 [Nakaseomyces bracarensis]|uniref:Mediator of RNA polymerase II transcription subunit 20 n=1 Tax=Nakaseomyces bracarensis TaxID=273131 RepID=A0ABR4NS41_9SACH
MSAVIFIERATPGTLTEFKDLLAKQLLEVREPWSLDVRTYRTQVKDDPNRDRLLYSLTFSHHDRKTVLMRDGHGMVLAGASNEVAAPELRTCSTGFSEPIDQLLSSKLSNMWTQRQVIRGDAGEALLITGGVTVRIVNLFTSTGFKGLLIELDQSEGLGGDVGSSNGVEPVVQLLKEMGVKDYKVAGPQDDSRYDDQPIYKLAELYIKVLEY